MNLSSVVSAGRGLPPRIILHGVEGIGKTSFGAKAPKPIVLMGRGETGLETLIDSGQLGDTPHFPEINSWGELLACVNELEKSDHDFKTVVMDTLGIFERLNHEDVCQKSFGNDWSDKGFMGYQRGFEVSLGPWREFLLSIDRLREQRKMLFIGLCHTKVFNFKNPEGSDYDRYVPAVHKTTWEVTSRWADIILFANYETFTKEEKTGRSKGVGGKDRILYTERTAAFDAKHRHGLPAELEMGNNSQESWSKFQEAMVEAKKGSKS